MKIGKGTLVRVRDLVPGDAILVFTICSEDAEDAERFRGKYAESEMSPWPPITSVRHQTHGRWDVWMGSCASLKPDWFVLLAYRATGLA